MLLGMATQPTELGDGNLRSAIARARRAANAAGELDPRSGPTSLPLADDERQALAAFRRHGYREASNEVGESDPELANC